jgi:exodeoxyribonuclease VII large subunit
MNPQVISVSEFLAIINETLTFAYPQVVIEGEVSSFKINQGKWVFFDIKDDANVLSCFMMIHQLKLPIEDGMKVRVTGSPKVTKFSKFSLTVRSVELAGEGELRRAMEILKKKLDAEGLFDPARKRPLPKFPARIGLITSDTSAAYSDFIKILAARWGGIDIILANVQVQGASAPDQVVAALQYFNTISPSVDVLVLIRGGGSLEDLIAFSTEPVARAVAASRPPIVVGVGHEIDFSLADYAADLRAATPSDAARLVVPDRNEVHATVSHLSQRMETSLERRIVSQKQVIDRALGRLEAYLRHPREAVQASVATLMRALDRMGHTVAANRSQAQTLEIRLIGFERLIVADRRVRVENLRRILHGLDPKHVLNRGYAIVRNSGQIMRDPHTAKPGDSLMIQLAKGTLDAEVRTNQ